MKKAKYVQSKEVITQYVVKFEELQKELRSYCHYKKCKENINCCPENCCSGKLGLDTAIAWTYASYIDYIKNELLFICRNQNSKVISQEYSKFYSERIDIVTDKLYDIVFLHRYKYLKLMKFINKFDDISADLRYELDDV